MSSAVPIQEKLDNEQVIYFIWPKAEFLNVMPQCPMGGSNQAVTQNKNGIFARYH